MLDRLEEKLVGIDLLSSHTSPCSVVTGDVVDSVKDVAVVLLEIGTKIAVDKIVDVGRRGCIRIPLGVIPAPISKL